MSSIVWRNLYGICQSRTKEGRWFKRQANTYAKEFTENIQPYLLAKGVPKEWAKLDALSELLPSWFHGAEEGEHLRNDAIFGRSSPQSAVQAHYVALDRKQLDDYYVKMMWDLSGRMSDSGFASDGKLIFSVQVAAIAHSLSGDDWALAADRIRALIVELREKIQQRSAPTLYEHHNLVTAYLGIGLSIATACRHVRTPIPDLTLIDLETGFMPMQEKDRSDGSHARIVWIPPRLRTAVDAYLSYVRGLFAVLPLNQALDIDVPVTKYRDRKTHGGQTFPLSLTKTLFIFDQVETDWVANEFTGHRLSALLDTILPKHWPIPNAGRHHAATSLFNAEGGFATLIKAVMGHSHLGESMWSPDSAFDPYRYREAITPVIEGMLDQVEFQAINF